MKGRLVRCLVLGLTLELLVGCDATVVVGKEVDNAPTDREVASKFPHGTSRAGHDLVVKSPPRDSTTIRQVIPLTASGEDEETPTKMPVESESRGKTSLEPDVWDPDAFTRPRRRMTIPQLDRAIRSATGGIGWSPNDSDQSSRWDELAPTLGVPDYYRRLRADLNPSMTFQKFLGDGANVICTQLIIHEQELAPEERVFFVHIPPGTNPVEDPAATDANIEMLLLRFHGKSVSPESPGFQPWRNLVNTIAANAGPWWGDWLEAWTGMCIALMKHPDFYSY